MSGKGNILTRVLLDIGPLGMSSELLNDPEFEIAMSLLNSVRMRSVMKFPKVDSCFRMASSRRSKSTAVHPMCPDKPFSNFFRYSCSCSRISYATGKFRFFIIIRLA